MHPHRDEALSSSRSKMRAVTGTGGGGSPHMGMSPFKRVSSDGVTKSHHTHGQQFLAHGGKAKKRGDRFARGGAVKRADGGGLLAKLKKDKDDTGSKNYAPEGSEKYGWFSRLNKGGAAKRANGGRTNPFAPRPTTGTGGTRTRAAKGKGNITVNVVVPQHHRPPGGGLGGGPGAPGGLGGLGGPPPGGAPAAAPPNPMAGAAAGPMGPGLPPGMAGGMAGAPGAPGAANPQAMAALQQIAGGGGAMGMGMPGRGPFARGGAAKSTGSNLDHWRNYASKNNKHNTAHERGATGESPELPLKTPVAKRADGGRTVKVKAHSRGGPTKRAEGGGEPFRSRWLDEKGGPNHPGWGPPTAGVATAAPGSRMPPVPFGDSSGAYGSPNPPMRNPAFDPDIETSGAPSAPAAAEGQKRGGRLKMHYLGEPERARGGRASKREEGGSVFDKIGRGGGQGPQDQPEGSIKGYYGGERTNQNRARGGRSPKIPVPIKGGADSGVGRKSMARIQPSWR